MSDTNEAPTREPTPERPEISGLPDQILDTYGRLWQLEIWLRQLVYVELRALLGDTWASKIQGTERPREKDKRLTHMPTAEETPLSYAQFSELCRIISEEWKLFEHFLPPKSIWEAKLEEIIQIRHRVAHFRRGHRDDLSRVVQLLRDIDKGFWRFCTSYNDPQPVLPPSDDPVVARFLSLDPFPWGQVGDRTWARAGIADPAARLGVTVEALCRPWVSWHIPVAGNVGLVYDVAVSARQQRAFDYRRLLEDTSSLHKHVIHICLDSFAQMVRLTIPAVLGTDDVTRIVQRFVDVSHYCVHGALGHDVRTSVQALADEWPEHILGPDNPLGFLGPDMPCGFFGV